MGSAYAHGVGNVPSLIVYDIAKAGVVDPVHRHGEGVVAPLRVPQGGHLADVVGGAVVKLLNGAGIQFQPNVPDSRFAGVPIPLPGGAFFSLVE